MKVLNCLFVFALFSFVNPSPDSSEKAPRFSEFLELFPEKELPVKINFEDLDFESEVKKAGKFDPLLREFIPELKRSMFSRVGPPVIIPIQSFQTEELIAVIYSSTNRFNEQHSAIICTTLDKNGKELNSFNLSYNSPSETTLGSIDRNLIVELRKYKNIWKKDVVKYGYHKNEIKEREQGDVEFYKINSKGEFNELKNYSTTARASLN